MTPVDWALNEQRFANWFQLMGPDDGDPLSITDYLALDTTARARHCAVVEVAGEEEGETIKLRIAPEMVRIVEQTQQQWQTLQELAGIVTPFTAQVEQEVEQRLRQSHQAELDKLKNEYDAKVALLQEEQQQQTAEMIRQRLMGLAGYNASGSVEES